MLCPPSGLRSPAFLLSLLDEHARRTRLRRLRASGLICAIVPSPYCPGFKHVPSKAGPVAATIRRVSHFVYCFMPDCSYRPIVTAMRMTLLAHAKASSGIHNHFKCVCDLVIQTRRAILGTIKDLLFMGRADAYLIGGADIIPISTSLPIRWRTCKFCSSGGSSDLAHRRDMPHCSQKRALHSALPKSHSGATTSALCDLLTRHAHSQCCSTGILRRVRGDHPGLDR